VQVMWGARGLRSEEITRTNPNCESGCFGCGTRFREGADDLFEEFVVEVVLGPSCALGIMSE